MGNGWNQPKVLIIGEQLGVRDTIRVLLGSLGCQCVLASSVQQALPLLAQENPDIAVIDPLATASSPGQVISGLDKLYPSLHGRIILLTGAGTDLEVREAVEHHPVMQVPRERLLQELWGTLELLLRRASVLQRITHAARLIFDSFLQPMPAGVRLSQLPARRLVYESGSMMADLWLEPQTDSKRIALVGQLVDSAKPDRRFHRVPVVLHGRKGPVALAKTNEFGEFHLDFDFEPSVTLEMETSANQWVSVVLPSLEGAASGAAAGS